MKKRFYILFILFILYFFNPFAFSQNTFEVDSSYVDKNEGADLIISGKLVENGRCKMTFNDRELSDGEQLYLIYKNNKITSIFPTYPIRVADFFYADSESEFDSEKWKTNSDMIISGKILYVNLETLDVCPAEIKEGCIIVKYQFNPKIMTIHLYGLKMEIEEEEEEEGFNS